MIHSISGKIIARTSQQITLQAGCFGFDLYVPDEKSFSMGEEISLATYMYWSAENGPSLFGFARPIEKQAFLLIISCSGIGPKIGLALLADLGAERFFQAIQMHDDKALSKVSGIGAKKAEQIIFQLKGKIDKLVASGIDLGDESSAKDWHTVAQALESLNYSRPEITRVMAQLKLEGATASTNFDQLMRKALSFLSK